VNLIPLLEPPPPIGGCTRARNPRQYIVEMLVRPAAGSPVRRSRRLACVTCPACTSAALSTMASSSSRFDRSRSCAATTSSCSSVLSARWSIFSPSAASGRPRTSCAGCPPRAGSATSSRWWSSTPAHSSAARSTVAALPQPLRRGGDRCAPHWRAAQREARRYRPAAGGQSAPPAFAGLWRPVAGSGAACWVSGVNGHFRVAAQLTSLSQPLHNSS
jgi:hypothetical protein